MRATRKICSIALALLLFCAGLLFQGMSERFALMAAGEEVENPMGNYDSGIDDSFQDNAQDNAPGITGGRSHSPGMGQRSNDPGGTGTRQRGKNFIRAHQND